LQGRRASSSDASEQSVSLANQRFDRGLSDSLNVIDALPALIAALVRGAQPASIK